MSTKLIAAVIAAVLALTAANRAHESKLQQAIELMETKGDLPAAIKLFEEVAQSPDRNLAARSLLYLGDCRQKMGAEESRKHYERVVREFADQREVASEAQARLAGLRPPQKPVMATRQIWTGPKVDVLGTVSPDGRYLSFVDWETGDLAVRDLAAGSNRLLTNKGSWNESDEFAEESAISRDGKRVAYSWLNRDFRYELRLANLTGEPNPRRLFDNEEVEWIAPYDWTPDGKWIAVQIARRDRTTQVGVISADEGSLRVLKSIGWRGPTRMFFTPDGKQVAYDLAPSDSSEERDIFLIAIDGSREIRLVEHPANDVLMGWAPDGSRLLFASDRTGTMSVWALPVSDGKPQGAPELIKTDSGRPWSMGITRSGAMFYGAATGLRDIHLASIDFSSGAVQSPPSRAVQTYIGKNVWPTWSLDGKYLSYFSNRGQADRLLSLVVRSMETGQTREFSVNLQYVQQPRWMPDGRAISAGGRDRKGRHGIYRIDVHTGEVSPILLNEPGEYANNPHWSPDGKLLYYRRTDRRTKEFVFLERDVSSGKEREVLRGGDVFDYTISPDGKYLAFLEPNRSKKSSALKVMPVSGGAPKELLRLQDPESIGKILDWDPKGRFVVFRKNLSANLEEQEIWIAPLSGDPPRKLNLNVMNVNTLSLHPDGRQVIFVDGRNTLEVWVMENFLPPLRASR